MHLRIKRMNRITIDCPDKEESGIAVEGKSFHFALLVAQQRVFLSLRGPFFYDR